MAHKRYNPESVPKPVTPSYSQGMEAAAGARWLYISGQLESTPRANYQEASRASAIGPGAT